jgi:hypothetical protein
MFNWICNVAKIGIPESNLHDWMTLVDDLNLMTFWV